MRNLLFSLMVLPVLAQAQPINFSPKLKDQKPLTYYLFKENFNAAYLGNKEVNNDTVIVKLSVKNADPKNTVLNFKYDFKKSNVYKTRNFNYLLARVLETGVDVSIDTLGSITGVSNRAQLRTSYKAAIEEVVKLSKDETEKKEFRSMTDAIDENSTLDYLVLEDIEVFFEIWSSQFDMASQYTFAKDIESPYSVYPIASNAQLSFTKEKGSDEVEATIECLPSPEAKVEIDGILKMLKGSKIIPATMADDEIFDIREEYKFVYDLSRNVFTFVSKLREHVEVGQVKLKTTKFVLIDGK